MNDLIMAGDIVVYDGTDPAVLRDPIKVVVCRACSENDFVTILIGNNDDEKNVKRSTLTKSKPFSGKKFSTKNIKGGN